MSLASGIQLGLGHRVLSHGYARGELKERRDREKVKEERERERESVCVCVSVYASPSKI